MGVSVQLPSVDYTPHPLNDHSFWEFMESEEAHQPAPARTFIPSRFIISLLKSFQVRCLPDGRYQFASPRNDSLGPEEEKQRLFSAYLDRTTAWHIAHALLPTRDRRRRSAAARGWHSSGQWNANIRKGGDNNPSVYVNAYGKREQSERPVIDSLRP
jgi:hypothetical protein